MSIHSAPVLHGTFTALVTPFNRDGSLDFVALDALVDSQLAAGIDGLVPCGTTGEAATMSEPEREAIIARVVQRVAKRVPVIAGTGAQGTAATIENQRRAQALGADFGLVVTPFYNKPTQEGLYRHYAAIADTIDLPLLVYNVPSRTACDLLPDLMARLASKPNIVGIKEATADLDRVPRLRAAGPHWSLLSGDDATTCAFVLMGGHGVISVASNVAPAEMVALVRAAKAGEVAAARQQHEQLRDLFAILFVEANPIPVKTALALMGCMQDHLRLPLCDMQPPHRTALRDVLNQGGWLRV